MMHPAIQAHKLRFSENTSIKQHTKHDNVWLESVLNDRQSLYHLPISERTRQKEQYIHKYREYLANKLVGKHDYSAIQEIIFLNMVWAGDVRDFEWSLTLAKVAVKNRLKSHYFKRTAASMYAMSVHEATVHTWTHEQVVLPEFHEVIGLVETENWIIDNILLAKYYKLAGTVAEQQNQYKQALNWFEKANQTYDAIGVKTRISKLKTKLK